MSAMTPAASPSHQHFVQAVEAYAPRLYRHLLRMLEDPQDAEDALQETFLKAYRNLNTFQGRASMTTWLYRIATNEALMHLRRRRSTPLSLEALSPDDGHPEEILLTQWQVLPEQALLSAETRQVLDEAVAQLSPALRAVFLLRDVEGFSTKETADILGISVDAVKQRLARARLRLREALAHYFDSDDQEEASP